MSKPNGAGSGGERSGDREVMERNVRDMVNSGVRPETAERMARESMRRVDQKQREQGKR